MRASSLRKERQACWAEIGDVGEESSDSEPNPENGSNRESNYSEGEVED